MTSASSALVLPSPSLSRQYCNGLKSSAHEIFQGQTVRSSARLRVSTFPSDRSLRVRAQVATPVESTTQKLGQTDLEVTKLGIGAWSWGDTVYWNDGSWDDRKVKEVKGAFDAGLDAGITLLTQQVYGSKWFGGEDSERLLGEFIKYRKLKDDKKVFVATKFASLPWRFGRGSVIAAVKESLKKLGVPSIDLYQIHWPGAWQNDEYIDGLGDAVEQGLVKAVGVSNFKVERLQKAHAKLRERNIPLASNQIHYSLAYRLPEKNGVKQVCDDLGVTVIAYSPIGQGVLSGKYTAENRPTGPRGRVYTKEFFIKAAPLLDRLKEVGAKYDKTPVQVSLNWLIAQGNVVPIPGAKSAAQAQEFAGALGWSLTAEEVEELRELSSKIDSVRGFPAESF